LVDQLILDHRPLPLLAKLGAVVGEFNWAPAIAYGITLPALLAPEGRLQSRRWRPVVAAAAVGPVVGLVAGGFMPWAAGGDGRTHLQPVWAGEDPGVVAAVVGYAGLGLWLSSCWPSCSCWCCGSGPPGEPSASSCAGWWPGPPGPWPGWPTW
jgi:hypothetical protein